MAKQVGEPLEIVEDGGYDAEVRMSAGLSSASEVKGWLGGYQELQRTLKISPCNPLRIIHIPSIQMDGPVAEEVHRLRDKPGETEKITINLGFVDLGHIDLLVHEGFYSNRTDFIRTAIRSQVATHADDVKRSIVRHTLELGLRRYSRARWQQSSPSLSLAPFRPAKQSRRRSLIASGDRLGAAIQQGQKNEKRFSTAMHQTTQLLREKNVTEATRVIQRALSGQGHALSPDEQSPECSRLIEQQTNIAEISGGFEQPRQDARIAGAGVRNAAAE